MTHLDQSIIRALAAPNEYPLSLLAEYIVRSGAQVHTYGKPQCLQQLALIVRSRMGWG